MAGTCRNLGHTKRAPTQTVGMERAVQTNAVCAHSRATRSLQQDRLCQNHANYGLGF